MKYIAILIFVGLALFGIASYNGLVNKDVDVQEKWSQVENVYQRRFDLIPNLVETVKGAANFEKSTFVEIAEARAKVNQISVDMKNAPASVEQLKAFQEAQTGLGSAMSRLMVVAEAYPALKVNENFLSLQAQLEGTENRISVERRAFNQAVSSYNKSVRGLPSMITAKICGFETKAQFEAEKGADKAPSVKF